VVTYLLNSGNYDEFQKNTSLFASLKYDRQRFLDPCCTASWCTLVDVTCLYLRLSVNQQVHSHHLTRGSVYTKTDRVCAKKFLLRTTLDCLSYSSYVAFEEATTERRRRVWKVLERKRFPWPYEIGKHWYTYIYIYIYIYIYNNNNLKRWQWTVCLIPLRIHPSLSSILYNLINFIFSIPCIIIRFFNINQQMHTIVINSQ
jgi:hypothetical protein